ncbi:MAG: pectin acetylesterase-family hydrolase [Dokdonella sp.]
MGRWFWGAVFLVPLIASAQINNCSDPYWVNSLRCKLLNPAEPQPEPAPPDNVAQLRNYTRVALPLDPEVRCLDGTRPVIYVDRAVGPPSNKWLISFTGGPWCAAKDLDHNGSFESGQECLDYYVANLGALMGTATTAAMSDLESENGSGILNPDPQVNPVLAGYNRVRVYKCGFDRHSGRSTHNVTAVAPVIGGISFDLFNHGQKIVLATLDLLKGEGAGMAGLSYLTWVDQGGQVAELQETLPSIADAEQVVFIGHSASGHGLYQNADRYSAYLRAMPGFSGDIRAIHDAHFMHSPENEAAFDSAQNPNPALFNTLFDQRYSGNTTAVGSYDAQPYFDGGLDIFASDYAAWLEAPSSAMSTLVDESCFSAHLANGDTWKCLDRFHVCFHHETTPALVREDFLDPNTEHGNPPLGFVVQWGPLMARPECADLGFSPCPPVLSTNQYAARLLVQAGHFLDGVFSRSELALGTDTSGPIGSVYLWMPACGFHEGAYSDSQYHVVTMRKGSAQSTYRGFIEDFLAAPATGAMKSYVTGLDGAQNICDGVLFANGFENTP